MLSDYQGRQRCNLYKTAVRMAENQDIQRFLNDDLRLLNLAIKSREQRFKTSHESHLALMGLQNQRSLVENQLLILTNRQEVLRLQRNELATGKSPSSLPVIVSLTAPRFSNPGQMIMGNFQLRILAATSNGALNAFRSGLKMEAARLIVEINNLAAEYALFSDELQLRRQESVAAALVGVEAGRLSLADVIIQKRLLIQDGMKMARLRSRQHELLADLVYLCGANSYEDLLSGHDK